MFGLWRSFLNYTAYFTAITRPIFCWSWRWIETVLAGITRHGRGEPCRLPDVSPLQEPRRSPDAGDRLRGVLPLPALRPHLARRQCSAARVRHGRVGPPGSTPSVKHSNHSHLGRTTDGTNRAGGWSAPGRGPPSGGLRGDPVKEMHSEEEIKARLRELTRETNRVRRELERMIQHEAGTSRSFTHDLKHKLKGSEQARARPSGHRR